MLKTLPFPQISKENHLVLACLFPAVEEERKPPVLGEREQHSGEGLKGMLLEEL